MDTFGECLRKQRESKGLTLYGIEKKYHFSRVTLSNIEKGKQKPLDEHLNRIAAIPELELSIGTLWEWMKGECPILDCSSPYRSNCKYFFVFGPYGALRRHFDNYDDYKDYELDRIGYIPSFNPWEDLQIDELADKYPEDYGDSKHVDLKLFSIEEDIEGCIILAWSNEALALGIAAWDYVLIDKSLSIEHEDTIAVWNGFEFYFKKVQKVDGTWHILPVVESFFLPEGKTFKEKQWEAWKKEHVYGVAICKWGMVPHSQETERLKRKRGKKRV